MQRCQHTSQQRHDSNVNHAAQLPMHGTPCSSWLAAQILLVSTWSGVCLQVSEKRSEAERETRKRERLEKESRDLRAQVDAKNDEVSSMPPVSCRGPLSTHCSSRPIVGMPLSRHGMLSVSSSVFQLTAQQASAPFGGELTGESYAGVALRRCVLSSWTLLVWRSR